jgi:hypothetical protein
LLVSGNIRITDHTSKWNLLGENADAPRKKILQRIGPYVQRWKRWVRDEVRDLLVFDGFDDGMMWRGERAARRRSGGPGI